METVKCKIADFNVAFKTELNNYKKTMYLYLSDFEKADFNVSATAEDAKFEERNYKKSTGKIYPNSYKRAALFRNLAEQLPYRNAFVLHAATFDVDGVGVAFAAHSGTGKTTHMRLWQQLLGERMTVVNGDKPIVRFLGEKADFGNQTADAGHRAENNSELIILRPSPRGERANHEVGEGIYPPTASGPPSFRQGGQEYEADLPAKGDYPSVFSQGKKNTVSAAASVGASASQRCPSDTRTLTTENCYAYGSPWNGKEGLGSNMRTPLKHICFIKRGKENFCEKIGTQEAINLIFGQVHIPKDPAAQKKTFELVNKLLNSCSLWIIHCNMDISAAETAYNTIFNV